MTGSKTIRKYSVVMGPEDALPQAFVVFRGIEKWIPIAAQLGYSGIELALRKINDVNCKVLDSLLREYNMEISAISTGQVFADTGLSFTDSDPDKRKKLFTIFKDLIDLASIYGKKINIGRVRGMLDKKDPHLSRNLFKDSIIEISTYAESRSVKILLEPVNRYELNFLNSLKEASEIVKELAHPNIYLMPDIFHMNIEEGNLEKSIIDCFSKIEYIHFADSNRCAPGKGHINFQSILKTLDKLNFNGWIGLEMLPLPDPEKAARNAIQYLRGIDASLK